MAGSRFAYVRTYEQPDSLLQNAYFVCRLDGKGFHKFATKHSFTRPNDLRALQLMNEAAKRVMRSPDFGHDILAAFGESDEYSFAFDRKCKAFKRRESKLLSTVVSIFTSAYVRLWSSFFPNDPLGVEEDGPSFDGRIVLYPTQREIIDYLKWRQVDTHINNLYNTTFWTLIQEGGMTTQEAHKKLNGTVSSQKHEILFRDFATNYNELPPIFRKGTLLIRGARIGILEASGDAQGDSEAADILELHEDLVKDSWWGEERCHSFFGT